MLFWIVCAFLYVLLLFFIVECLLMYTVCSISLLDVELKVCVVSVICSFLLVDAVTTLICC